MLPPGTSGFLLVMMPRALPLFRNAAQGFASRNRARCNGKINKENSLCGHIGVDYRFNVAVGNLKVKSLFGHNLDGFVGNNLVTIITPSIFTNLCAANV